MIRITKIRKNTYTVNKKLPSHEKGFGQMVDNVDVYYITCCCLKDRSRKHVVDQYNLIHIL